MYMFMLIKGDNLWSVKSAFVYKGISDDTMLALIMLMGKKIFNILDTI